jgi:hypothetical protein
MTLPDDTKHECHSCGRSERLDALKLCKECRSEYDAETAEWEAMERLDDDVAATRAYYGA